MNFEMAHHIYMLVKKERSDAIRMEEYYTKKLDEAKGRRGETEDQNELTKIDKEIVEAENDVADEIERRKRAEAVIHYFERKTLADMVAE